MSTDELVLLELDDDIGGRVDGGYVESASLDELEVDVALWCLHLVGGCGEDSEIGRQQCRTGRDGGGTSRSCCACERMFRS